MGASTQAGLFQAVREYSTGDVSPLITQDVLLMAGIQDHYFPFPMLGDQLLTVTAARSVTARAFTEAEQAQTARHKHDTSTGNPAFVKKGHWQMHVNGRHLAVESAGTGPAVVFLHGIGGTSNVYQVQADPLSSAYQVIRPDFAGAGRSPAGGEISIGSHAADIAAVLDALGAGPAVIVGHSMGTLVARALAARHPAKIAGLALLGPVQPPDAAGREAILARAARRSSPAAPARRGPR